MTVKVGSFTKSTAAATASQAVTGVGFKPRALILWTAGATAAGTWVDSYMYAMGFCARDADDVLTVGSASMSSEDNAAVGNTSRRQAAKALSIVQYGESTLAECDLTSMDANGFTLSWTTNDANAYIIHYMALGGPDITDAAVVGWNTAGTGSKAVTGAGFQPDCVMHLYNYVASSPGSQAIGCLGIGAMTASDQWCDFVLTEDNHWSGTAQTLQYQSSLYAIYLSAIGTREVSGAYTSMDEDGFTVSVYDPFSKNLHTYSLCLKGGSYDLGRADVANSTGDQEVSGVGFLPEGVFLTLHGSYNHADSSATGGLHWSMSASDGTANHGALVYDKHYADPTNTGGLSKTTTVGLGDDDYDQSLGREGALELDADGFTVAWSDATDNDAFNMQYFAFAGGAAAAGGITPHAIHYKRLRQ